MIDIIRILKIPNCGLLCPFFKRKKYTDGYVDMCTHFDDELKVLEIYNLTYDDYVSTEYKIDYVSDYKAMFPSWCPLLQVDTKDIIENGND